MNETKPFPEGIYRDSLPVCVGGGVDEGCQNRYYSLVLPGAEGAKEEDHQCGLDKQDNDDPHLILSIIHFLQNELESYTVLTTHIRQMLTLGINILTEVQPDVVRQKFESYSATVISESAIEVRSLVKEKQQERMKALIYAANDVFERLESLQITGIYPSSKLQDVYNILEEKIEQSSKVISTKSRWLYEKYECCFVFKQE